MVEHIYIFFFCECTEVVKGFGTSDLRVSTGFMKVNLRHFYDQVKKIYVRQYV